MTFHAEPTPDGKPFPYPLSPSWSDGDSAEWSKYLLPQPNGPGLFRLRIDPYPLAGGEDLGRVTSWAKAARESWQDANPSANYNAMTVIVQTVPIPPGTAPTIASMKGEAWQAMFCGGDTVSFFSYNRGWMSTHLQPGMDTVVRELRAAMTKYQGCLVDSCEIVEEDAADKHVEVKLTKQLSSGDTWTGIVKILVVFPYTITEPSQMSP